MALVRICDKCHKPLDDKASKFISFRIRKCCNQHDGSYETRIRKDYDLCDKCAKEIESLICPKSNLEEVIYT